MSTPNETTAIAVQKREITAAHAAELGLPSPEAINYMSSLSKLIINSALITPDMICGTCQGKGTAYSRETRGYVECWECHGEFDERKVQANAMAKMLVGHEMKIPAIQALQEIDIVKGRIFVRYPQLLSQMMRKGFKLEWVERTHTKAALKVTPPHDYPMGEEVFEFTMQDATLAGLADSDQYKKRPRIMLQSRVISEAYRATGGQSNVYTPEEREEITKGDNEGPAPKGKQKNVYLEGMEDDLPNDNPTQQTQQRGDKATAKDEVPEKSVASSGSGPVATGQASSPAVVPEQFSQQPAREESSPSPSDSSAPAASTPRSSTAPTTPAAGGAVSSPGIKTSATAQNKTELLDSFAHQKVRLGEKAYYAVLGAHGVEKSTQFKTLGEARTALKQMEEIEVETSRSGYVAQDDDLPEALHGKTDATAPATTAKPKNAYVEEINKELDEQSLLYNKKSPAAVLALLKAFFKSFYGGTIPKPDAANIDAIRLTLRFMRQVMVDYTPSIIDNAASATAAGNKVAIGVRECLKYLEGRSLPAKLAFWDVAIVRHADSGGKDTLDWLVDTLHLPQSMPDEDFTAFMLILSRKVMGVSDLLEYALKNEVSIAALSAGWGVDVKTCPQAGLEAFVKGAVKAPVPTPGPTLVKPPAAQEAQIPEEQDDSDGWLTGLTTDSE